MKKYYRSHRKKEKKIEPVILLDIEPYVYKLEWMSNARASSRYRAAAVELVEKIFLSNLELQTMDLSSWRWLR